MGASHGIGHQLGPLGVGHGETSCILPPAVCKYNAPANVDQQRKVCQLLWRVDDAAALFSSRGLSQDSTDLGDILNAFILARDQPRTLRAVNVTEYKFPALARISLKDQWCRTNARPLMRDSNVLEILEMVEG